jgi:hypothetical protein
MILSHNLTISTVQQIEAHGNKHGAQKWKKFKKKNLMKEVVKNRRFLAIFSTKTRYCSLDSQDRGI